MLDAGSYAVTVKAGIGTTSTGTQYLRDSLLVYAMLVALVGGRLVACKLIACNAAWQDATLLRAAIHVVQLLDLSCNLLQHGAWAKLQELAAVMLLGVVSHHMAPIFKGKTSNAGTLVGLPRTFGIHL